MLALTAAAGASTHIHFAFVLAAGLIVVAAKLYRTDPRRLINPLVAVSLGYVIALILFPIFTVAEKQQSRLDQFDTSGVLLRAVISLAAFAPYFYILPLGIGLFLLIRKTRTDTIPSLNGFPPKNFGAPQIFLVGLIVSGLVVLLYVLFLTPVHAMGIKYLSIAWPFLSFSSAIILNYSNHRYSIALYFYLVAIALSMAFLVDILNQAKIEYSSYFDQAEVIVVDNRERGILPQLIWHIPDDKIVIADSQNGLLRNFDNWDKHLNDRAAYISIDSVKFSDTKREDTLARLRELGFETSSIGQIPIRIGHEYTFALIFSVLQKG